MSISSALTAGSSRGIGTKKMTSAVATIAVTSAAAFMVALVTGSDAAASSSPASRSSRWPRQPPRCRPAPAC
jgi:hypothetical protein